MGIFLVVVGLFWVVVDGCGWWHGFSIGRLLVIFLLQCAKQEFTYLYDGIIYLTIYYSQYFKNMV